MTRRPRRLIRTGALALSILAAARLADAKDVYKCCLDPGIPHHRAILDTLARIDATPNDARLHNDLGCLVARDGFWRDALREFDVAAGLDRKDAKPHFNAGLVRVSRNEWRAARRAFAKAADRDPGNWPAWWMLGYANERLGRTEAAVEAYKRSLRVDTSLFDPARNPYAANSALKSRVLLETLDRRLARAAQPQAEQIADPERMRALFQRALPEPAAPRAAGATPFEEQSGTTGPVVSVVPTGSGTSASPERSGGPGSLERAGSREGMTSFPNVSAPRRRPRPTPAAAPDGGKGGSTPGPGGVFPNG